MVESSTVAVGPNNTIKGSTEVTEIEAGNETDRGVDKSYIVDLTMKILYPV